MNGLWDYGIGEKDAQKPGEWAGEILVPFAPEAPLSGVGRLTEPTETLWYKRSLPGGPGEGKRTLLHFEAVDDETTVWVNGKEVSRHRGGNTPFFFDITDALGEIPRRVEGALRPLDRHPRRPAPAGHRRRGLHADERCRGRNQRPADL